MTGGPRIATGARQGAWGFAVALCVAAASGSFGCVQEGVSFYRPSAPPVQADRLALTGRVCTADPAAAQYPLRILIVGDRAAGPLFSDFDAGAHRVSVLSAFVQSSLADPSASLAVIGFGPRAQRLAPEEGTFTRNPGELLNAMTRLATPEACDGEALCRDPLEALRAARALIEADLASLPRGRRILTSYAVLFLQAGMPVPMAKAAQCCLPGELCSGAEAPSATCQTQLMGEAMAEIEAAVIDGGAAAVRLHAIQLAADPDALADELSPLLQGLAFAGGGRFSRVDHVQGLGAAQLDVGGARAGMRIKQLIVANVSARANGPVDSDADGVPDTIEDELGTHALVRDTDGDGVSDLVESLVRTDPNVPLPPLACAALDPAADADLDGLTDCDEALLGTDSSLVDTDGDAMPDRLEVAALTDYVIADDFLDADGDGVSNGDELAGHTDPRSSDLERHFEAGYRYDVVDEGLEEVPVLPALLALTGVTLTDLGRGSTRGIGTLTWDATARTLSWQDASDGQPGPAVPVENVDANGTLLLPSSSWAPLQGEEGRFVRVRVAPADLPGVDTSEQPRVLFRERQCLTWTVRNVTLVGTRDEGINRVRIWLAQAPAGRPQVAGPFRLAEVPVVFVPPAFRDPATPVVTVLDSEFVDP